MNNNQQPQPQSQLQHSRLQIMRTNPNHREPQRWRRWFRLCIYVNLVVLCQAAATLLGRLYFVKGGKSKWLATLAQVAGFPVLIPFLCVSKPPKPNTSSPSRVLNAAVYSAFGASMVANCMLFSMGMQYLPVSTFSLLSSSQLAFNAVFSFFINAQKLTPFVVNSIVVLSVSAALLVFQGDDDSVKNGDGIEKGKFVIGFFSTVGAAAVYALSLSFTQLWFQKVMKRRNEVWIVIHMMLFPSIFASSGVVIGLIASKEWEKVSIEMEAFQLGMTWYVIILVSTALCWQAFMIGAMGLIFEVSALSCNIVATFGLPVVPIFAAIFFHEKMSGLKVIAMLLAIWGFLSYVYQHYIDDTTNTKSINV